MKLLTPAARLLKGTKLKFVPHSNTNSDYVGLVCTLTQDYNGGDLVHIEVMSPYNKRLQREECYVVRHNKPRLAILDAWGFGAWIKGRGL